MRRVAGQHVGAHQQEADPSRLAGGRQPVEALGHPLRQAGVVEAGLGVAERLGGREVPAPGGARAGGVAAGEEAHEVDDVLVRAGEPVLQGQEVRPHVLGRARDEAQNAGDLADQRHLARAVPLRAARPGLAAQALEEIERAALRPVHGEAVHPGGADHFRCREAAHHRVALGAAGEQGGEHRPDMLVHEQHRREHDVGPRDVGPAGFEGRGVRLPFGGGVEAEDQAGRGRRQHPARPLHRPGEVVVEGDDDDAQLRQRARSVTG